MHTANISETKPIIELVNKICKLDSFNLNTKSIFELYSIWNVLIL